MTDVDQVEWRVIDGLLQPVAVLELSRVDGHRPVPSTYLLAVLDRMFGRDQQGACAVRVAEALGVRGYVVLFRHDLTEFWVWRFGSGRDRWAHGDADTYARFLREL